MMTVTEAGAKLTKEQDNLALRFCPLIKGKCRKDCASFYSGSVKEATNTTRTKDGLVVSVHYNMFSPACTNALINGAIGLEQ